MRKIGFVTLLLLAAVASFAQMMGLPANGDDALARLDASPRKGEWITYDAGAGDRVEAWVVHPERQGPAPVVVVVHENRGLNDWARAVADQFAAEGFLAIAPDFISGKAPGGQGTRAVNPDAARQLIGTLQPAEVVRRLRAAAQYATGLPSTSDDYAVVGYCWGGAITFSYATMDADLGAAVVFYGTSPPTESLRNIQAPVLGLYGGSDNRVNATIPDAEAEMKRLGKRYEVEIYDGAGHAFLRGQQGDNMNATQKSWPRAVGFLKEHLGSEMSMTTDGWGQPESLLAAFGNVNDCADVCDEAEHEHTVASAQVVASMNMPAVRDH